MYFPQFCTVLFFLSLLSFRPHCLLLTSSLFLSDNHISFSICHVVVLFRCLAIADTFLSSVYITKFEVFGAICCSGLELLLGQQPFPQLLSTHKRTPPIHLSFLSPLYVHRVN